MHKINTIFCLVLIVSIIAPAMQLKAQCGCAYQFETTFPATVREAPVVIEGKITGGLEIFGGEYNQDWHSSVITVYKVLKGNFEATEVELIEPSVWGDNGCFIGMDMGIFFLYPSKVTVTPRNYIAPNLKFRYKDLADTGCNFVSYNATVTKGKIDYLESPYGISSLKDIRKKVYDVAEQVIGHEYTEIAPIPKKDFGGGIIDKNMAAKLEEVQAISISSISPTTITAGTFDTLTIKGSGFTPDWLVAFRSTEEYDDNYIHIPENHYIIKPSASNDTMYKVLVPCIELDKNILHPSDETIIIAGTGKVALRKGNVEKKSSQTLTVSYAQNTYALSDTSKKIYPIRLARNSPNGNFAFWLHPTIRNNTASKQLLKQAVQQWRCATGVNFTIACDSTELVPLSFGDHVSTISMVTEGMPFFTFLNGLKAGTLKKLSTCNATNEAIITETDIIFRDHPTQPVTGGGNENLDWYYTGYSPGNISSAEYDFYTMALHELGHAHVLDHVVNNHEIMNTFLWNSYTGVIHNFNPSTDLAAAANIIALSTTNPTNVCLNAMQMVSPANCALPTCANIGCTSPGYPLQVSFNLYPEHCLDDLYYLTNNIQGSWYQMVATTVPIIAKDQSMGNIVSRQWNIQTDPGEPFSNLPCNDLSTIDTCRSLFWTLPGNKNLSLTVTDANGCTATYQQSITVIDTCPLDLPIETSTQLICNPNLLGCGSNQNIQLQITDLTNILGSGCFRYLIEYNATDPTVSTTTQIYTDLDLIRDETQNKLLLNCLPQGYYKIKITDEITACEAIKIIYLTPPASQLPIIDQYTNLPDAGCNTCTGQIQLLAVNGNTDLSNYTFAWSVCPECNTTTQSNLCTGIYTITATDNRTGCSAVKGITINYDTGGDTNPNGVVTGLHISVEPTVFNDVSNVRIAMPEAGEITIEVYNLNGVLVKKLVDKVYYTQGEFIIPHNATNLNDGLYVYKLKVCEKQKTDIGIKY